MNAARNRSSFMHCLITIGITVVAPLLSFAAIAEDNQPRPNPTRNAVTNVPEAVFPKPNFTLSPHQPLISFGLHLPQDMEGRIQLTAAEEAMKAGKFPIARSHLEEVQKLSPPINFVACVRLADMEAMTGKMEAAIREAATCFLQARNASEPFKAVAALRVLAYGGTLLDVDVKTMSDIQASTSAADPWIREEVLFDAARLHYARHEYSLAYQNLLELYKTNASTDYLVTTRPLVLAWLADASAELTSLGHYATLAGHILDALNYFTPLDEAHQAKLALEGARNLRKAGAGALAADILLWLLRKQPVHSDPAVLQLLTEAFLDSGDAKRAQRTLQYLQTIIPMSSQTALTLLLKGRVAEMAKDTATAIIHYQAAVKADHDPDATLEAAWRGALLLREGGKPADALALLSVVGEKSVKFSASPPLVADAIMLRADLAYEQNRTDEARFAYRLFAARFSSDPRVNIARYRLLRIDPEAFGMAFKGITGSDCWSAASEMIKQKLALRRTNP